MNDYKELIVHIATVMALEDECGQKELADMLEKAADAIEQLVADNESYKCGFADLHNEIANYCETIAALEKERDAAVADLHELFTKDESPCAFCVAEHCDKCIIDYPYWEWRGVGGD